VRLTLRNLLAYLHEMMSAADRAEFEQLIESAPRVRALLERCKRVTRQRELKVLAVEESNPLYDADAVANYIDFAMADSLLPAFEKGALESDEQLAEIVDCHGLLADVVRQRVADERPTWKPRLLALVAQRSLAGAETHEQPSRDMTAENDETEQTIGSYSEAFNIERAANGPTSQSSPDLSQYLLDDDEGEISQEAADVREKDQARAAIAGGPGAVAAHGAHPPAYKQLAAFTAQDHHVPPGIREPKKRKRKGKPGLRPWMYTAICGGTAAGLLLIWLIVYIVIAPPTPQAQGAFWYGVPADPNVATCEITGRLTVSASGSPVVDAGALVVVWPDDVPAQAKVSAEQVQLDAASRKKNTQKPYFVAAVTDAQGEFRIRMLNHDQFHVLALSRRLQVNSPPNWNQAVEEVSVHVSNPEALVDDRIFRYEVVDIDQSRKANLRWTLQSAD
jgi:hypothetical protein